MFRKISTLVVAMLSINAFASDYTQADQTRKISQATDLQTKGQSLAACRAFAEAEEMGYLGDPSGITDSDTNYQYTTAALQFAKCLDENTEFAKEYDIEEMNSIIVYTTLNSMYNNKAAKAFLDQEMTAMAQAASLLSKLNNSEIINGSERASLACSAAHTGHNAIGFTGRPNERKNSRINKDYVSTGIVLSICNVYHPYFTKSTSRYLALNEASQILTELAEVYGSDKARQMLTKVKPMLDAEKNRSGQ